MMKTRSAMDNVMKYMDTHLFITPHFSQVMYTTSVGVNVYHKSSVYNACKKLERKGVLRRITQKHGHISYALYASPSNDHYDPLEAKEVELKWWQVFLNFLFRR